MPGKKATYPIVFRAAVLLALLLSVLSSAPAFSAEVAVITGNRRLKVHDEVLRGFGRASRAETKVFGVNGETRAALGRDVSAARPRLILAIGYDALAASADFPGVPVVFALAMEKDIPPESRGRATGVDLWIPPGMQFDELLRVLPGARRIGVVYNPNETGALFAEAKAAAAARGLSLVGERATTTAEAVAGIRALRGGVDVLWMLPDITVLDYETVKYLMQFSFETKTPVFALSEKYVKSGALMGLGIDPVDIGVQAGEMAERILAGASPASIPVVHVRKGRLSLNLSTAAKFDITIPPGVVRGADEVYGGGR